MKRISVEEVKRTEYEILCSVHSYCEKHNLTCWLTGGTLLGAVRHKGFIPWDDDIDIMMPRYDYEKFIRKYHDPARSYLSVKTPYNDREYYLPFAKVTDTRTIMKENISITCSLGVSIDVFPLDYMGNDKREAVRNFNRVESYRRILTLKCLKVSGRRSFIKNSVIIAGRIACWWIDVNKLAQKMDQESKKRWKHTRDRYLAIAVWGIYGAEHELLQREWLQKTARLRFEDQLFYAPAEYDRVLKKLYGDYMKLPPEKDRTTHHEFQAYLKTEKTR